MIATTLVVVLDRQVLALPGSAAVMDTALAALHLVQEPVVVGCEVLGLDALVVRSPPPRCAVSLLAPTAQPLVSLETTLGQVALALDALARLSL
jgi:hypothetical protein